jgi:c-di-GMP-binding flagellar brake protein YcgR
LAPSSDGGGDDGDCTDTEEDLPFQAADDDNNEVDQNQLLATFDPSPTRNLLFIQRRPRHRLVLVVVMIVIVSISKKIYLSQ